MKYINSINILYDSNMNTTYQLYKQGKYSEMIIYQNIIEKIKQKNPNSNKTMEDLIVLLKDYMAFIKVDKYTEKIAVKEKDL